MSLQDIHDYYSVNHPKSILINVSDGSILNNTNIVSEKFELTDSISSGHEIVFGSCESACLKLQVATADKEYKGLWLDVRAIIEDDNGDILLDDDEHYLLMSDGHRFRFSPYLNSQMIGRFKVVVDEPVADKSWRNLTCYDEMYDILRAEVYGWYKNLTFPMTLKQLRDSFFDFLGVEQEEVTLINDNLSVKGQFSAMATLTGRTIIKAICELNGVFGHMNADGKFAYLSIPSSESIEYRYYVNGSGTYERDLVQPITGIIARDEEEDAGTVVGTLGNPYVITGNPFVFGIEGTPELTAALNRMLTKISAVTYRPFSVTSYGDPIVPIGTSVTINTRDMTINSFIMTRRLTGVQALRDTITAKGEKERLNDITDLQTEFVMTGGRIHRLQVTVDELLSEIEEGGFISKIQQLSNEITLKVDSSGNIVQVKLDTDPDDSSATRFSVQAKNISFISNGKIELTSNSLEINSTNFSVTSAGVITAKSGTIGGFTIDSTSIRTGTLTSNADGNIGLSTVAFSRTINGTSRSLRFAIGSNFGVGSNGALYSSSGNIGGFTIGSSSIYNGMTSRDDTTNNGIWIGTTGIALGKGAFKVTNAGSLTASSGTVGGWTISATKIYGGDSSTGVAVMQLPSSSVTWVYGAGGTSHSSYANCPFKVSKNGSVFAKWLNITPNSTTDTPNSGYFGYNDNTSDVRLELNNAQGNTNVVLESTNGNIRGYSLTIVGTKSRVASTNDYGDRLLYCYETPTPMFGDIGEGIIAEDGKCYIWTDAKFSQTISNDSYQVFLQKYGQGECYVIERKSNYFVVEGDVGMKFGWEIKAKQSGYEALRLDKHDNWNVPITNYGVKAAEHISEIQEEREVA